MGHYAAIDVHAHYFPQSFLDLIAKHGPSHGFEKKWSRARARSSSTAT